MGVEYSGTRATPRMDLGVAVMEYVEQENEFIGTQILPIFRTQKQKSVFPAITRESITRDADTKRATRGNYNRDGFSAKDKSYSCQEHGRTSRTAVRNTGSKARSMIPSGRCMPATSTRSW